MITGKPYCSAGVLGRRCYSCDSGGRIKYGGIDFERRELCGPRDKQTEGAHKLAGPGKGGRNQPVLRQNYSRFRRRPARIRDGHARNRLGLPEWPRRGGGGGEELRDRSEEHT